MTVTSGGPATISSRTGVGGLPVDLGGLAALATQGDTSARDALLANVRTMVHRYCRARLGRLPGSEHAADDVAQEVCLALLRALPTYRDVGKPFSAFVYRIAAHKVADAHRAAMRDLAVTDPGEVPATPSPEPGPEQQAVSTDLARRLSGLLARLPETQREIILLRVAVGLAADEVGEVVGMTAAAVRVAQARALAKLRMLAGDSLDEAAA